MKQLWIDMIICSYRWNESTICCRDLSGSEYGISVNVHSKYLTEIRYEDKPMFTPKLFSFEVTFLFHDKVLLSLYKQTIQFKMLRKWVVRNWISVVNVEYYPTHDDDVNFWKSISLKKKRQKIVRTWLQISKETKTNSHDLEQFQLTMNILIEKKRETLKFHNTCWHVRLLLKWI